MSVRALAACLVILAACAPPDRRDTGDDTEGSGSTGADGGSSSASCGNGVLEAGETCDPAIASGRGACPTECPAGDACAPVGLTGAPEQCTAACTSVRVTACRDGDGCCPANCAGRDSDCTGTCGNGQLDHGETCDGNCPTSCDDGDPCTQDSRTGSASTCNVQCGHTPIANCGTGDTGGGTTQCKADTDCGSGYRCCTDDGACHLEIGTVALGGTCDCAHACASGGTCVADQCGVNVPKHCRPGCSSDSACTGGTKCVSGACITPSSCDPIRQDCPDAPLNPSQPASASNPIIRWNCTPETPTENRCYPAGPLREHQTGCLYQCSPTSTQSLCAPGLVCVTPVDQSGNATGPALCEKMCSSPSSGFPSQSDCPTGELCNALLGENSRPFPVGACSSGF